jgi:hypothetical protein
MKCEPFIEELQFKLDTQEMNEFEK